MSKFQAPNVFIGSTVFFIVFLMMMTPLAAIAFGFMGIKVTLTHALIGITGLILFYVLAIVGFYGDDL